MLPYSTTEEFSARVGDCVIMLWDTPIYVTGVSNHSLKYMELPLSDQPGKETHSIKWNHPDLHANDFKLGYINVAPGSGYKTAYLTRMPARISKQGLSQSNVFVPPNSGLGFSRALYTQGLADMLVGKYPRMSEAIATVKRQEVPLVAFARRWAIELDRLEVFCLHYRGRRIATGFEPGVFKLPQHALHLRELIEGLNLKVI